jgi:hypothetical protein
MTAIDRLIAQAKSHVADLEEYKKAKTEADRQTADLVRYLEGKAGKRSGNARPRLAANGRQVAKHS